MRRICLGFAGAILAVLAGCSDSGVQDGPIPFKGTSTEPFNAMKNQMAKNVQSQAYATKPAGDTKSTAETKPATQTKPAAETKPEEKKKG